MLAKWLKWVLAFLLSIATGYGDLASDSQLVFQNTFEYFSKIRPKVVFYL